MNLRRIDLNLLIVLDAILAERNITRAADRLHLSQPALSHALARLRIALNDPIVTRQQGIMVPSPKALRLQEPLRKQLEQLESMLTGLDVFDSATLTDVLYVGASDYAEFLLMPAVVEQAQTLAPRLCLITRSVPSVSQYLSAGKVDMAIVFSDAPIADLHQATLVTDRLVCLMAADRPAAPRELTLESYLAGRHVQVSLRGVLEGAPDKALAARGLMRTVGFATPHFLAAASMVARTDLIMTIPFCVAQRLASQMPLRILELPIEHPQVELRLVWHPRTDGDAGRAWVRGLIMAAAETLRASPL